MNEKYFHSSQKYLEKFIIDNENLFHWLVIQNDTIYNF